MGLWATPGVVHKSTGRLPKRLRGRLGDITRVPLGVVVGQPMWPVKDRQAAVGIFVHAHRGAHKMRSERARRDVQGEAAPLDRVVVADPAILLDRQDVAHPAGAIPRPLFRAVLKPDRSRATKPGQMTRQPHALGAGPVDKHMILS